VFSGALHGTATRPAESLHTLYIIRLLGTGRRNSLSHGPTMEKTNSSVELMSYKIRLLYLNMEGCYFVTRIIVSR